MPDQFPEPPQEMENMAASEVNVMETSMMSQSSNQSARTALSMRQKSHLKRRINKEHNSNFRAGYVLINEDYLHRAGIRGRKRFLVYAIVGLLVLLSFLNLAMTAWLMWIYRITHIGVEPLEFVNSRTGSLLRFLEPSRFDSLLLSAQLGSRYKQNLVISSINSSSIVLSANRSKNGSEIWISKDKVRFTLDDLTLMTSSGAAFFSLHNLDAPIRTKNLLADMVETKQIRNAPSFNNLSIETWNSLEMIGAAGIETNSEDEILLQFQSVSAKSESVTFNGSTGIYFQMDPRKRDYFKVCVCRQSRKLFYVGTGFGCANATEKIRCRIP